MGRSISEALHARRQAAEDHIRTLKAEGKAGDRYSSHMPDIWWLALGLLSDAGWLTQVVAGAGILMTDPNPLVTLDLCLIAIGVAFTAHLNRVHEKEIALRHQKNLSFGLVSLAGIVGIAAGLTSGSPLMCVGGLLNTAGCLPILLSFRKGIEYGVR